MENVGTFYCLLVYFMAILVYFMAIWQFSGDLVYFPHFGALHHEKSGNP
jgi:hypothetical protein